MRPALEELEQFAVGFSRVPVWEKIPGGARPPTEIFKACRKLGRHCFILESLEDEKEWGRYTFLGFDPKLEISALDGVLRIKNGAEIEIATDSPDGYLKKMLGDNRSPHNFDVPGGGELPPFTGGFVGYFSFDYIKYVEKTLTLDAAGDEGFKDFDLMLFDKIIAWDHLAEEIFLIVTIKTEELRENYRRAVREIDMLREIIETESAEDLPPLTIKSPWRELFDRERFCAIVEQAKYHIKEGDIFQVVLSNQIEADVEGSLFDTYSILRKQNPSPYMFYFSSDALEIAGASPETLVKLKYDESGAGNLFTFPLAGTRRRGATEEEDAELEKELLADPKELAEHNMLVDLGRNDLGKLCEFSSVVVEKYKSIERFSHVMHIGSTVRGKIRKDKSALDAINTVLPAGTLSGAPKIRACEIINRLEDHKRGIYGGAIGYIDFSGNMDTCISIRIAYKKNGKVFVRSGAGIVFDSVPENEYEECRNKMRAVVNALEQAAKGRM
jgi:anthranilate synthase component 1